MKRWMLALFAVVALGMFTTAAHADPYHHRHRRDCYPVAAPRAAFYPPCSSHRLPMLDIASLRPFHIGPICQRFGRRTHPSRHWALGTPALVSCSRSAGRDKPGLLT